MPSTHATKWLADAATNVSMNQAPDLSAIEQAVAEGPTVVDEEADQVPDVTAIGDHVKAHVHPGMAAAIAEASDNLAATEPSVTASAAVIDELQQQVAAAIRQNSVASSDAASAADSEATEGAGFRQPSHRLRLGRSCFLGQAARLGRARR